MSEEERNCYFCSSAEEIEQHHIIPRRYGGPDLDGNLVDVFYNCHIKLERLYDDEFFEKALDMKRHPARTSSMDPEKLERRQDVFDLLVVEDLPYGDVVEHITHEYDISQSGVKTDISRMHNWLPQVLQETDFAKMDDEHIFWVKGFEKKGIVF